MRDLKEHEAILCTTRKQFKDILIKLVGTGTKCGEGYTFGNNCWVNEDDFDRWSDYKDKTCIGLKYTKMDGIIGYGRKDWMISQKSKIVSYEQFMNKKTWIPEHNKYYWVLDPTDNYGICRDIYSEYSVVDKNRVTDGNYFKTRALAIKARKAIIQLMLTLEHE